MGQRICTASVLAATAVVNYDLLRDETWKRSSQGRMMVGIGLAGSAAEGDSEVEVYVNSELVANLYNTDTGFPNRDDILPVRIMVPAGGELVAKVVDAPATNPLNISCLFAN